MSLQLAVVIFVIIIIIFILIIEIFTILFRFTGLNEEKSKFQVISLLTNSGFTTRESEMIVTVSVRRNIAKFLMMFGYIFSVAIASSIINIVISITRSNSTDVFRNICLLGILFSLIFIITKVGKVKIIFDNLIRHIIEKTFIKSTANNPIYILDVYGKCVLCEMLITKAPDFLENKTVIEAELRKQFDISVLTISRNGQPHTINVTQDIIQKNDRVVLFGELSVIIDAFDSQHRRYGESYHNDDQ